jgi:NADH:ubiquinone oxidoreductase subunit 6 (subunit J)
VTGQDAGLASGVQQAVQQVGAGLGLSVLVTLALRHAGGDSAALGNTALTQGYVLAFRVAAVLLVVAGVLAVALLERVSAQPRMAMAEVDSET